jgi:hypothetical protein
MREQLNDNPMVQIAVVVVLLLAGGIFMMTSMGGGEEEAGESAPFAEGAPSAPAAPGSVETLEAVAPTSTRATLAAIPPVEPPAAVIEGLESGATVVLLFVREGGIDDRLVRNAAAGLSGLQDVASIVVPAQQIARYTGITGKLGVDRVPALVVLGPKEVDGEVPTASVQYGYQTPQSIVQAVVDAGYEGPTLDYHP